MLEREICRSEDLVDGGAGVRFEAKVGAGGTAQAAFAIRFRGAVHGYLNRCSHVPVELDWEKGQFFDFSGDYLICSTHGALYGPESGRCLGGRCNGRGLTPVPLVEHDGVVYCIDKE